MAQRLHFQNSNEVGVFAMLSNAYCLCTLGTSENFVRARLHARSAVARVALRPWP
jgi:translation initiation factor 6 (eIF-6)